MPPPPRHAHPYIYASRLASFSTLGTPGRPSGGALVPLGKSRSSYCCYSARLGFANHHTPDLQLVFSLLFFSSVFFLITDIAALAHVFTAPQHALPGRYHICFCFLIPFLPTCSTASSGLTRRLLYRCMSRSCLGGAMLPETLDIFCVISLLIIMSMMSGEWEGVGNRGHLLDDEGGRRWL